MKDQKRYIAATELITSIFEKNTDINLSQLGIIESTARSYRYRHKLGKLDLNAQRNMLRALGYDDMQLTVNPDRKLKNSSNQSNQSI